jgi:hypothetical protein
MHQQKACKNVSEADFLALAEKKAAKNNTAALCRTCQSDKSVEYLGRASTTGRGQQDGALSY